MVMSSLHISVLLTRDMFVLQKFLTHAEGSISSVAVHTDTVVAAYGVLTVGIHITHIGTKNTFINIWEWEIQNSIPCIIWPQSSNYYTCTVVDSISRVARTADTGEVSSGVVAVSIFMAVVSAFTTLVYICKQKFNIALIFLVSCGMKEHTYSCRRFHSSCSHRHRHSRSCLWCSHSRHSHHTHRYQEHIHQHLGMEILELDT